MYDLMTNTQLIELARSANRSPLETALAERLAEATTELDLLVRDMTRLRERLA